MSIPAHGRPAATGRRASQWFGIALLGALVLAVGLVIAAGIGPLLEGAAETAVVLAGGVLEIGGLITLLTGLIRGALAAARG